MNWQLTTKWRYVTRLNRSQSHHQVSEHSSTEDFAWQIDLLWGMYMEWEWTSSKYVLFVTFSVCLSVGLFACLSVSFSLSLPSPPPPPPPLPSYPYFLFLYLRIHLCFFQVLLLITDGRQTMISSLFEPTAVQVSTAIKARGIKISAIGIGAADPVELWTYASKPEDTLFVNDFSVLCENILETRRLLLGPGK